MYCITEEERQSYIQNLNKDVENNFDRYLNVEQCEFRRYCLIGVLNSVNDKFDGGSGCVTHDMAFRFYAKDLSILRTLFWSVLAKYYNCTYKVLTLDIKERKVVDFLSLV